MPTTPKDTKTSSILAGLSDEERADLIREIRETQAAPVRHLEPRSLTPRERAIRLLLPERSHMEACPIIDNAEQAVGRVEAYSQIAPAAPGRGRPAPAVVTVARCMECGGSRVHPGTLEANLLAALGQPITAAAELDTVLG